MEWNTRLRKRLQRESCYLRRGGGNARIGADWPANQRMRAHKEGSQPAALKRTHAYSRRFAYRLLAVTGAACLYRPLFVPHFIHHTYLPLKRSADHYHQNIYFRYINDTSKLTLSIDQYLLACKHLLAVNYLHTPSMCH